MRNSIDWISDAWDWLVHGPTERCLLIHHPEDENGREFALNFRADINDQPLSIKAADSITLDDEEIATEVGHMVFITIRNPGLLRSLLWRARPINVRSLSFEGEAA